MQKPFNFIFKLISWAIAIGIIVLSFTLVGGVMLVIVGGLALLIGSATIPAIIKTMKDRKKRKKAFKKSCKKNGIKPNMKSYDKSLSEEMPFKIETMMNVVDYLRKIPGVNIKIDSTETDMDYMRNTVINKLNEAQLEKQAEMQKIVYGLTISGEDLYFATEEEKSSFLSRVLTNPNSHLLTIDEFRLYYEGDFNDRSNVIRIERNLSTEYIAPLRDNTIETYVPAIKGWALELDTNINIEEISDVYNKKGITSLKSKMKKKNY